MDEKQEVVLTSVEQLSEYLRENGNEKTVISVVLELVGKVGMEGDENDGRI